VLNVCVEDALGSHAPACLEVKYMCSSKGCIPFWTSVRLPAIDTSLYRVATLQARTTDSPTLGPCIDDGTFADALGYPCTDWVGYSCGAWLGYSVEQMSEIRFKCPIACETCPIPDPVDTAICQDSATFTDIFGYYCYEWIGYGCDTFNGCRVELC
jgi:hypothetical protein